MRALVLSGGGSKGAFTVGVLRNLLETRGLDFDLVVGTSTGSLITPFVVAGLERKAGTANVPLARLGELYTSQLTADILRPADLAPRLLTEQSLFDAAPLRAKILRELTTGGAGGAPSIYDVCSAGRRGLGIATVDLLEGRSIFFVLRNRFAPGPLSEIQSYQVTNANDLVDAVFASSCEPVVMPATSSIAGVPGLYVDGGVRSVLPVEFARACGADEIWAVLLTPKDQRWWVKDAAGTQPILRSKDPARIDLVEILQRTIDVFCFEVAESCVRRLYAASPAGPNPTVHMIWPSENLEQKFLLDGLEFDPRKMLAMMDYGEAIADAYVPAPNSSWHPLLSPVLSTGDAPATPVIPRDPIDTQPQSLTAGPIEAGTTRNLRPKKTTGKPGRKG